MKKAAAGICFLVMGLVASGAYAGETAKKKKDAKVTVKAEGSATAEKDAERYLSIVKPEEILRSALVISFGQSPDVDFIMKEINLDKIRIAMKKGLVKIYTAEEMKLLADFVSQPGAKNILSKSGLMMKAIGPELQSELTRVIDKKVQLMQQANPATQPQKEK